MLKETYNYFFSLVAESNTNNLFSLRTFSIKTFSEYVLAAQNAIFPIAYFPFNLS